MENDHLSNRAWGERLLLALLFVAIGSLIIIVFNPWKPLLGRVHDYLGRIGLIGLLLVPVLLVRGSKRFERHWQVLCGLLVLAVAVSLDLIISIYLIDHVGVHDTTPAGWALQKLNECLVVVSVIILLTKMSRNSLGSIYIQKGNLKLGLTIGLVAFVLAVAGSIPMANLFKAQDLSFVRIRPWIPWILIFVLANATMEEIMFRGLFLRKLEPLCGKFISNLMITFVFTVLHGTVAYASDQYIFLAVLFPLALAWGYVMQKTDGVWGSILFHAGMDIPIMLGIFSNLF